jgi:hypothetical protein
LLKVDAANLTADGSFQCAFPHARSIPDSATRLDSFLNQYGLCRNVAMASSIAALFLIPRAVGAGDKVDIWLSVGAVALAFGLFVRFIKFYAAYTREVFRAFDKAYPPDSPAAQLA